MRECIAYCGREHKELCHKFPVDPGVIVRILVYEPRDSLMTCLFEMGNRDPR